MTLSAAAIVDPGDFPVSANALALTAASGGIGTASNPLETSVTTVTVTAATGNGVYLSNNTALTVNSATAGNGDLSISAEGNLTLLGAVVGGNVTLASAFGA